MLDEITQMLISLGIKPEKRGFRFLKAVLEMLNGESSILKDVYAEISERESVNICTIDSSIRNAIISAHKSKKLIRLNELFGCDVINPDLCPTNKEFIMYLHQYLEARREKAAKTAPRQFKIIS